MFSAAPGTRDPQSFDHLVARYDRYAELVGAELRTWLSFHLPAGRQLAASGRALDAGCGTGMHTELLAERCNEVLAVDVSVPMLDYASTHRAPGNVRYEQRDLHEVTPGQDGPFDVLLCAYTLHHVPDFVTALEHLRSLARPGGTVLLVDVVDDRRCVPRAWLRREALRGFRDDLIHRRRPLAEAAELLRLSLHPDWLDHQATDHLWPPHEWDTITSAVYPGAAITPLYRARALAWQAPAPLGHYQ